MEIEIKGKIDTLEIIKSCKQELRKTVTIIISTMILIYFIYIYKEPSMFLLFPIYVTPLAYIIFTIVCQRYKYEVIFIDTKQIRFSSSYTEKNSKTSMTSFFKIENLKEIYVMEYHQLPPKKFFGITKYKNIPHYMIHFIFSGEEDYQCWGYKISIEEATRVVRRIEEFLEKQKNFKNEVKKWEI